MKARYDSKPLKLAAKVKMNTTDGVEVYVT